MTHSWRWASDSKGGGSGAFGCIHTPIAPIASPITKPTNIVLPTIFHLPPKFVAGWLAVAW